MNNVTVTGRLPEDPNLKSRSFGHRPPPSSGHLPHPADNDQGVDDLFRLRSNASTSVIRRTRNREAARSAPVVLATEQEGDRERPIEADLLQHLGPAQAAIGIPLGDRSVDGLRITDSDRRRVNAQRVWIS
jgi:hypothetical protein